jgi:hypothetical protein
VGKGAEGVEATPSASARGRESAKASALEPQIHA